MTEQKPTGTPSAKHQEWTAKLSDAEMNSHDILDKNYQEEILKVLKKEL
jgi:hypothetical protein